MEELESTIRDFLRDAADLALRAIDQDKEGNWDVATYFYRESIALLDRAREELQTLIANTNISGDVVGQDKSSSSALEKRVQFWIGKLEMAENKAIEYTGRITELETLSIEKQLKDLHTMDKKSEAQVLLDRAMFFINQGLDNDDKEDNADVALKLYEEGAALCIEGLDSKKNGLIIMDEVTASQLRTLAENALGRAEILKKVKTEARAKEETSKSFSPWPAASAGTSSGGGSPPPQQQVSVRSSAPYTTSLSAHASDIVTTVVGNQFYTDYEKKVLYLTSKINSIDYLPWMEVDLQEKFATHLPFDDRDGYLQLSPKQKKNFVKWVRPDKMWSTPKMIERIDCFSIKQTVISDCSFVASLSVSALYEKKFKKKLITSIIYPRNKAGEPLYNPCGKYLIKLILNGVPRKIVVDDHFPVGKNGELLCSYSNNKGELWVSLLEKAYMKVMGGYDFPGSNSNIDLHALTGWIPERVAIHSSEIPFEKDKTFRKLQQRMGTGDVLVTVATGLLSDKDADRAGLVSTHAYAVLDVREVKGVRLFLLKNPWSHLRWKGNYSELDTTHWTDEMKRLLNYDPGSASMFDNGVFWIDYDSICKFFDVFYLNWNPALFTYTYCIHGEWAAGVGPSKDVYNISENPQYRLTIDATKSSGGAVWILLTRHITDIQDFKENREYITVVVYDTDGRRVFYPYEPPPMIEGVRINSPHYLCNDIKVHGGTRKRYTLVVSQHEKAKTIQYTLRVYSSVPFQMEEIIEREKYVKKVTGEWKGKTAGGCGNHPDTWPNNPRYKLSLRTSTNDNSLILELKAPKEFYVGCDIECRNVSNHDAPGVFSKKSSGNYRPGFVVLQLYPVPTGVYHIIPSTFKPGSESSFFLKVKSSCDFTLEKVQ